MESEQFASFFNPDLWRIVGSVHLNSALKECGDSGVAGAESPVNQRGSGIWAGYVGVLL